MDKKFLALFGSEWFGVSIATLALAEVYILAFSITKILLFHIIGEIIMFLGLSIFAVIFVLWVLRFAYAREKGKSHWDNLTRLSFIALIPIIGFVGNSQLIYFFGLSGFTAELSLINYAIDYILAILIGVLLGYRLYTKEIDQKEINYAIVLPPLAIGTSVLLASSLISFFAATLGPLLYFLTIFGFGIFFFLYIFIGSLALAGHVSTKNHETLPTIMLPVGIASLMVINLLALVNLNSLGIFVISASTAGFISLMLWGFEVWNFLVVAITIFAHPSKGNLSVWAYGFPLGLFALSTLKIMSIIKEPGLVWVFALIAIALNAVWIYGWINTRRFVAKTGR